MRWEYKIVDAQGENPEAGSLPTEAFESKLNELGASDWELIGIVPSPAGKSEFIAVLKRPSTDSRW